MKKLLIICALALVAMTGCASLNNAGSAEYTFKPFVVGEKTICCELSVKNGKELKSLHIKAEKKGEDYAVEVDMQGVTAFKGQETVANAAVESVKAAITAAAAAVGIPLLTP